MKAVEEVAPLVKLYGEGALDEAAILINELSQNSNFAFTADYLNLGISFLNMKAIEILNSKVTPPKMKSLISEAFGEAAIAKFQ